MECDEEDSSSEVSRSILQVLLSDEGELDEGGWR
eukprot:SAG11_NODE_172_length_13574_cov_14.732690_6_plen_34_part_00